MGMEEMKILNENNSDENENKKKDKKFMMLGFTIFLIIMIIMGGIFKYFSSKSTQTVEAADVEDVEKYKKVKDVYSDMGIDYTEEDYKKDEKMKANPEASNEQSSASQKIEKKNNEALNSVNKISKMDIDSDKLKQSIIDQLNKIQTFIKDHGGYPDDKYDDKRYRTVKSYNDKLIAALSGGEAPKNAYNETKYPMEQQKNKMRYAIDNLEPYSLLRLKTEYHDILKNYFLLGHPNIDKIDAISIETHSSNKEFKERTFDDSLCDVIATIVVDKEIYKVYLCTSKIDGGESMYKILDIEKQD